MHARENVLGIDVGAVSVALVELDPAGRILHAGYAFHHGKIRETLAELGGELSVERIARVARTTTTPELWMPSLAVDTHVAEISAAGHLHPQARGLLCIGGERFRLTRFDEKGAYLDTRTNSSCAAGTGSFLDQQAETLGLADSATLAATALAATGEPPKIASRCAVFAKTDLIHAQQEGFTREAICNGLCLGLATIVADTLFSGEAAASPIVVAGGVAKNRAVIRHLQGLCGAELVVDEHAHLYAALGAARSLLEEHASKDALAPQDLAAAPGWLAEREDEKSTYYPPLELTLSTYPDFAGERHYEYSPREVSGARPVEVDIYRRLEAETAPEVYLGVDIGSTSTKAVAISPAGEVIAGFYTRTSGRPLAAVQGIFETIEDWAATDALALRIRGAGTTGSGRKFIGSIIGADLVVDEITAHARAAFELDPAIDTIIEIGGQDAKFTTLKDGRVTFAAMNTVCAAGTGSFIEEQARRLHCPLEDYAERVASAPAPMASDRCTVFMQRDINHFTGAGYASTEILATVLHAVRENYLRKVARQGSIGERICFQGATAKNRALVAAFEQKLRKPIHVSRYCHLTGALGTALMLAEHAHRSTTFRGTALFREEVPVRSEVCELCRNHCKVALADVQGEIAAYGFLCGRDYEVEKFVSSNRSGFDLLKAHRRAFRSSSGELPTREVTVGIPAALYLVEEMPIWKRFFAELGLKVITDERDSTSVTRGKKLAQAEFCAPMAAWHGQVAKLAERADYVFAPIYLEARDRERERESETRRQYCYYSQYASSLVPTFLSPGLAERCLTPLVTHGIGAFETMARLYGELKPILDSDTGFTEVANAYTDAVDAFFAGRKRLCETFLAEREGASEVQVVLLGRPYACLVPSMNKGIPDIFARLGVKAFFQDMVPYDKDDVREIAPTLRRIHWGYAAKILEVAEVVAKTEGLYPVLVTCFKCTPDSCIIELFRRILDHRGKPYVILELDEHDSSVGYETRIEAAVRSFRNHHRAARTGAAAARRGRALPVNAVLAESLAGKSVFVPNWDSVALELVVANLRREGIDAHLLEEDERTIQRGMRRNTGQCIPMGAVVQGFVDQVRAQGLDPADTLLWMISSRIACNLGFFTDASKTLLESYGGGFEKAGVYGGDLTFFDVSTRAALNTYFAYLCGGYLRKMACRVRPYEQNAGETDAVLAEARLLLRQIFAFDGDKVAATTDIVDRFVAIEQLPRTKPKVAVFGDMYVRDNEVMSQNLVRYIEEHGGEVISTPYTEFAKIIADAYFKKWLREGEYLNVVINRSLLTAVKLLERRYLEQFARVLGPGIVEPVRPRASAEEMLGRFSVTARHTGESMDNILKIFHLLEAEPDLSLFVQTSPAFCCPSLVTEAMAKEIMRVTGVPVVSVTYDGTASSRNDVIIPYLEGARRRAAKLAAKLHSG